jgi:hypothetical protein
MSVYGCVPEPFGQHAGLLHGGQVERADQLVAALIAGEGLGRVEQQPAAALRSSAQSK